MGVNWPICMRMFIHQESLKPMCTEVGFKDITVDTSNSLMSYELPEDPKEQKEGILTSQGSQGGKTEVNQDEKANEQTKDKNRVHVGSDEFKHLKNYDMNKITARVTVIAQKPL